MAGSPRSASVLVVYYSRFGVLHVLAEQIAAGVRLEQAVEVGLMEIDDQPIEELRSGEDTQAMALRRAGILDRLIHADAIIVGGPAYFGSMASPLKRFFEDCVTASYPPVSDRSRPWHLHLFRDKVGAAFTASATPHGGNEMALHSMLTMLMHLGMIVVTPGQQEPILANDSPPYGAIAISGPGGDRVPDRGELASAQALGLRVARLANWLHAGRTDWEKRRPVEAVR